MLWILLVIQIAGLVFSIEQRREIIDENPKAANYWGYLAGFWAFAMAVSVTSLVMQ